jgi:LytTr DNA-binding domain
MPQPHLRKTAGFLRGMTEPATHASPNAALLRRFLNGFLVAGVAAVFMAVTGAFNTDVIGFWPRLTYWLIVMQMGSLIGVAVNAGVREWGRFEQRRAIEAVIVAILIAFPLTLIVTGASMIFFGMKAPALADAAVFFAVVAFISLIMTGINYLLPTRSAVPPSDGAPAQEPVPDPQPIPPGPPRFAERLPIGLQSARILALSAEDHYLRVHTDAGDALILMRLSDAIAEIEAANGLQTHRSWWVARDAVTSAKRSESKGVISLANGVEAPVSRTYLKAVGAAGWFA